MSSSLWLADLFHPCAKLQLFISSLVLVYFYFMCISYIKKIPFTFSMFYPQDVIQFFTEITSLFQLVPSYLFIQNSLKHVIEWYLIYLLIVTSSNLWTGSVSHLDFSSKNQGFFSFSRTLSFVYVENNNKLGKLEVKSELCSSSNCVGKLINTNGDLSD